MRWSYISCKRWTGKTGPFGVRCPKGIAIAGDAGSRTIAHEVLHDCGLEDIYIADGQGNLLFDPVIGQSIPADWGGGNYLPGLTPRTIRAAIRSCRTCLAADGAVRVPSLAPCFHRKRMIFVPPGDQPIAS
jgi:hypothetical protein